MLSLAVEELLALFEKRVLPFDADAARHYARLAVLARRSGRGFPTPVGFIAAIANARGFAIACRDTAPYEAAGLEVTDPWGSNR